MNFKSNVLSNLILLIQYCIITSLFYPGAALAYVDPGSGSVIVTTILGLIAAIGYTCRKYFYKLKGIFSGKKSEMEEEKEEQKDGE